MKMTAGENTDFERVLPEEGPDTAVCYQIVDLGTHETEFKGQKKKRREIQFSFELPNQTHVFDEETGEQPLAIFQTFTMSLAPQSKLRPFLEKWRNKAINDGDEVDFSVFLGQSATINIAIEEAKSGKEYAKIVSIKPPKKKIKGMNSQVLFSLSEFSQDAFDALPEWMQNKIKSSQEWAKIEGASSTGKSAKAEFVDAEEEEFEEEGGF